jgi:hypothetical protein
MNGTPGPITIVRCRREMHNLNLLLLVLALFLWWRWGDLEVLSRQLVSSIAGVVRMSLLLVECLGLLLRSVPMVRRHRQSS